MKGLTITDSEKKLLFIVLALLILVLSYFFGFTKLMDEASTIELKNEQDASLLAQLQNMVARQAETVAETEKFKQTIKDVIAKYPVDLPQEKIIYLMQLSEDTVGVDYSSISFSMDNSVMTIQGEDETQYAMYASVSVPYKATYEQVKQLLEYTAAMTEDRTVIPSMNISYDTETGALTGSITYRMYYLRNTDRKYEQFPETGIESGMPDIFHTSGEDYAIETN